MSQSSPNLPSATPGSHRPSWMAPALIVAAIVALLAIVALVVALRWFVQELGKADPIPGITIEVDPGGAVDREGVEHATHAFLNRRLREAGYERDEGPPLRIEVTFKKVGELQYQHGDKTVTADKVRLELSFYDASGRRLKTVTQSPEMHEHEEFQYDAEIGLNKTVYDRAVSQILKMKLPRPDEL